MKKSMIDEDGVDFLGMRLAITLVATALLIGVASACVDNFMDGASRAKTREEAGRIASLAEAEYASGCPGNDGGVPISVTIPRIARYVAFGGQGTYLIEFSDGSLETYAADCRFSPATLYPGEHRLILETANDNGTYLVKLTEGQG